MLYENTEYIPNTDDFDKSKLVKNRQTVFADGKSITVDGYQLPGYESFAIREYQGIWVLSIKGKLLTYGSYEHITDVITLLLQSLACWHSETSMIHFLNCKEYAEVIEEILYLRTIDHTAKQQR